jgi:hypothetical protein
VCIELLGVVFELEVEAAILVERVFGRGRRRPSARASTRELHDLCVLGVSARPERDIASLLECVWADAKGGASEIQVGPALVRAGLDANQLVVRAPGGKASAVRADRSTKIQVG